MSALGQKADSCNAKRYVCSGPKALHPKEDMCRAVTGVLSEPEADIRAACSLYPRTRTRSLWVKSRHMQCFYFALAQTHWSTKRERSSILIFCWTASFSHSRIFEALSAGIILSAAGPSSDVLLALTRRVRKILRKPRSKVRPHGAGAYVPRGGG
jgi:hypothetical protein